MKNPKHDIGCRVIKFLAVLLATVPFTVCWYAYFADNIPMPFFERGNWVVIALFVVLYITFARVYDAFWISVNKASELAYSQVLSVLLADAIMYIVIWLLNHRIPNLIPCLITMAAQTVLVAVWSYAAQKWYFASFPAAKTAVVYSNRRSEVLNLFKQYELEKKFKRIV